MPVIANPHHPNRVVALEIAVRVLEIALVAIVIFGILPVIAEAAA